MSQVQNCQKLSSSSQHSVQGLSSKNLSSSLNLAHAHVSQILHRPSQDDFIALVVRNYVPQGAAADTNNGLISINQPRICGAWVEVLPNLRSGGGSTSDLVLTAAVEALATSILTQKLNPNRDNVESFQSYELALRSLRKGVAVDRRYDTELLASIMCLSLVEVCHTFPILFYLVTRTDVM
jgi:hypothetical protein